MKFHSRLLSVSAAALLLIPTTAPAQAKKGAKPAAPAKADPKADAKKVDAKKAEARSEERRVGKECA